ncbi:uncharacterized protein LOC112434287 isoform X2 [Maylandia zebra]|uniref:uncharacterized protein LOC112434287 isoform X2 n=1 Tax=Maylandia zebra TaxID=106582 RepID=UPI00403CBCE8
MCCWPTEPAGDEPPQLATPVSEHIQDEDGPYVKKPPNAFMLYLKEQRPKVIAELNIPGSAAVNAVVGQREAAVAPKNTAKATEAVEPIKGAAVDDSVTAEKISKDQPVAVTHPTFWERIQEQLRPERIRCLKTVKLPNSKLEFYKSLMKRLCYQVTDNGARLIYIRNISPGESRDLREALKKMDCVRNYLPLLNKVFIEFQSLRDADRLGVWYSLLKRATGHKLSRLKIPQCGCTSLQSPISRFYVLHDHVDRFARRKLQTGGCHQAGVALRP